MELAKEHRAGEVVSKRKSYRKSDDVSKINQLSKINQGSDGSLFLTFLQLTAFIKSSRTGYQR